jgi:hypothetical protein
MNVAISEGVRLSDDNARTFARHMLADLRCYNDRASTLIQKERIPSIGNPKGQARFFRRLTGTMGPTMLDGCLYPGKRCAFDMVFFHYTVDSDRLLVSTARIKGLGVKGEQVCDVKSRILMCFTLHALQRLIQRSGVKQSDGYLTVLQGLQLPALKLVVALREGDMQDDETWPLPVVVSGQRVLMLVKRDGGMAVVTTVYKGTWRGSPELDALETSLSDMSQTVDETDMLVAEFRAAAKRFERDNHA